MNDIHVTIIAILGMLLTLAVVFDIYLFIDNSKLCKSDAEHKLEAAELQNKLEEVNIRPDTITVEKLVVEPIILKNKISFSDHISMDEQVLKRIIFEDLAKNLVDIFLENPEYVMMHEEYNPMFCNTTYQTIIRLVPFKEEIQYVDIY